MKDPRDKCLWPNLILDAECGDCGKSFHVEWQNAHSAQCPRCGNAVCIGVDLHQVYHAVYGYDSLSQSPKPMPGLPNVCAIAEEA